MKIRSTAVMSTSALTWRSSCPGVVCKNSSELLPYGIYTIPEISMVGKTEAQLTDAKIPYEVGIAKYEELAKGQILGDGIGLLKILFDPGTLRVLGMHVIGENAAEIVHIGQAVLSLGATIEYFRDTVFNYPTLAEAYKLAALDGLNKLDWKGGKYNEDQNTTFGSFDSSREAYNHWNCFRV